VGGPGSRGAGGTVGPVLIFGTALTALVVSDSFLLLFSVAALLGPAATLLMLRHRLSRVVSALRPLGERLAPLMVGPFFFLDEQERPLLIVANVLAIGAALPWILSLLGLVWSKAIVDEQAFVALPVCLGALLAWPVGLSLARLADGSRARRRCGVKGNDGGPSGLWLEARNEAPGEADLWLGHGRGRARFVARVSLDDLRRASVERRPVDAGDVRVSFDAERGDYRLDYEPSQGPDHGLRLWVGRDDLESLLGPA
jgi:hypothetical protein